jgi:hypothetical protein
VARTVGKLWICAFLVLVPSCRERPPKAESPREAIVATQQFWVKRAPNADLSRFSVRSWDEGQTWRIVYTVDGDPQVHPSVFVVDKRSGKVIRADFHP